MAAWSPKQYGAPDFQSTDCSYHCFVVPICLDFSRLMISMVTSHMVAYSLQGHAREHQGCDAEAGGNPQRVGNWDTRIRSQMETRWNCMPVFTSRSNWSMLLRANYLGDRKVWSSALESVIVNFIAWTLLNYIGQLDWCCSMSLDEMRHSTLHDLFSTIDKVLRSSSTLPVISVWPSKMTGSVISL